jgi:hypothetical protein
MIAAGKKAGKRLAIGLPQFVFNHHARNSSASPRARKSVMKMISANGFTLGRACLAHREEPRRRRRAPRHGCVFDPGLLHGG